MHLVSGYHMTPAAALLVPTASEDQAQRQRLQLNLHRS